jgi:phage terminase small subunit
MEWERVGPELIAKQLLTVADMAAFTLYCLSVSRVVACEKRLNRKTA